MTVQAPPTHGPGDDRLPPVSPIPESDARDEATGWMERNRERLALAAPAVVGTALLLVVVRHGAYASPDSAFYLGVARSLLEGDGLATPPGSPPLSQFPPLFPVAVAGLARLLGTAPLPAAALLNALLFGVTAWAVAVLVRRRSGSVPLGVVAGVAVVVAADLLVYFGSALSEPMFVVLALGTLVALATALREGSREWWVAASALAAAACLTRYLGVALVAAGAVAVVRRGGSGAGRRAAAYSAAALAPLALWLAAAGGGERTPTLHLFDHEYWLAGARSLSQWLAPAYVPWSWRAGLTAVAAAGVAGLVLASRRAGGRRPGEPASPEWGSGRSTVPDDPLGGLLAGFAVAYVGALVVDRVLFEATGRLDLRFLAVLHVIALVGLLPWLHRRLEGWLRPAVASVGVVLVGLHGLGAAAWVVEGLTDTSVERRGLSARAWAESGVMATVASLPPGTTVFSNAPEAVQFVTGRPAEGLPARVDSLTERPVGTYRADVARLNQELAQGRAVVVWLHPYAYRRHHLVPLREVRAAKTMGDEVASLRGRPR